MREKLNKMLAYQDMVDYSKMKEIGINALPFYKAFPEYKPEQERRVSFQRKVTKRIENRMQTLKLEL